VFGCCIALHVVLWCGFASPVGFVRWAGLVSVLVDALDICMLTCCLVGSWLSVLGFIVCGFLLVASCVGSVGFAF